MTVIHHNSGPSAQIEPIEALFDRLCHLPLDPAFEEHGNFIDADDGETHFFGGFFANAAAFTISTNDRALVDTLSDAIGLQPADAGIPTRPASVFLPGSRRGRCCMKFGSPPVANRRPMRNSSAFAAR